MSAKLKRKTRWNSTACHQQVCLRCWAILGHVMTLTLNLMTSYCQKVWDFLKLHLNQPHTASYYVKRWQNGLKSTVFTIFGHVVTLTFDLVTSFDQKLWNNIKYININPMQHPTMLQGEKMAQKVLLWPYLVMSCPCPLTLWPHLIRNCGTT